MGNNTDKTANINFGLNLDDHGCSEIVQGAVKLLDETGIRLKSDRIRAFFSSFSGIKVKNDRVYFTGTVISDYLEGMRQHIKPLEAGTPFTQGQGFCCFNWCDTEKEVIRPATEEDLVRAVRFLDSYGVQQHLPPVAMNSYPPAVRDLHGTRVCIENSPVCGAPTNTPAEKEVDYYRQMASVAQRKIWILAMLIRSPLEFNKNVLEFVLDHHEDKEFLIEMTSGMPSPGSTSPLLFPAAQILGLAEDLAACFFMYAITGEYTPPYLRSDPFDLRYLNYCVGSPEYALLDLMSRRLYNYLTDVPREWGYFLSMSRWPDQQAAHERTVSCWLQAFAGATHFKGSGQLSHDEVYSLEQVVIDRTIMKGAEHMVMGLKLEKSIDDSCQVIREGMQDRNFFSHDTTLENFYDFYCQRELFPAMNLEQWRNQKEPTPLSMASEVIEKNLSQNTYRRDEKEIHELRRICYLAEKALL